MKSVKLFVALVLAVLLLAMPMPVAAAPPEDNPGKGPPDLEKTVFIHYRADRGHVSPNAKPGKPVALYSYSKIHWSDSKLPVPYWINLTGSPVASTDAVTGITASFQTWENDPLSHMRFAYNGTTTTYAPGLNVTAPDYQNVVGWADLSATDSNAIGITVVWSSRATKLIVDADTVLNTASMFAWTQASGVTDPNSALLSDTARYDVDVQNIMTHEAGHWLMLNDLYDTATNQQTMHGVSADRELKKRSLESGDIEGIRKIYPGA